MTTPCTALFFLEQSQRTALSYFFGLMYVCVHPFSQPNENGRWYFNWLLLVCVVELWEEVDYKLLSFWLIHLFTLDH